MDQNTSGRTIFWVLANNFLFLDYLRSVIEELRVDCFAITLELAFNKMNWVIHSTVVHHPQLSLLHRNVHL